MKTQEEMMQLITVNNLLTILIIQVQLLIGLVIGALTHDPLFAFVVSVVVPLSIIIIGNHKK